MMLEQLDGTLFRPHWTIILFTLSTILQVTIGETFLCYTDSCMSCSTTKCRVFSKSGKRTTECSGSCYLIRNTTKSYVTAYRGCHDGDSIPGCRPIIVPHPTGYATAYRGCHDSDSIPGCYVTAYRGCHDRDSIPGCRPISITHTSDDFRKYQRCYCDTDLCNGATARGCATMFAFLFVVRTAYILV